MALQLADRVQVTSTSYTTSSFTLASAVTGFQAFTVLTSGNTTYYTATDSSGNWEVGYGTYTTGALARTTILSSSNSGSVVTFSGTVNVWIDYPAEKAAIQDSGGSVTVPQLVASNGIIVNNMTIGTSYTIPTGYSGHAIGPITLSSGVSVTVPSGSRWLIL